MMRRKSIGGRRRSTTPSAIPSLSPIPPLSTSQENDHNATATLYDSDTNNDHHPPTQVPDSILESEPIDSLDNGICISCNQCDGALLVCTGTDCPISVHVTCIGSQPKFDDSGNFYCPYCWYKRTLNNTKLLKQKALIAKKALSSFLDETQTLRKDAAKEPVVEPVQDPVNHGELRVSDSEEKEKEEDDDNRGTVSETGSSVSEIKDSDYKPITVKKDNVVKSKVAKKSLLPEQNGGGGGVDVEEEEVTSSRSRLPKQQLPTSLTGGKRKPLFWTDKEEKALKEGVLKFSKENKNVPWRKILEFGCCVFDKTRTPADLKDKWKKISSKKGRK